MSTFAALVSLLVAAAPVIYTLSRSQRERNLLLKDAEIASRLPDGSDPRIRLEKHVQNRVATMVDREEYGTTWRHPETLKAVGLAAIALFLFLIALLQPAGWVRWTGIATTGIYLLWAGSLLVSEMLRLRRQKARLAAGVPATG